jgi:hypothetical protein
MAHPMYGSNKDDNRLDFISDVDTAAKTVIKSYALYDTNDTDEHQLDVLPTNCILQKVWINVLTAEATATTKTIDIGLNGGGAPALNDPDGLADGLSTAATGLVQTVTASNATTLGKLFNDADQSGSSAPASLGGILAGGNKLTYTLGEALTEGVIEVHVMYIQYESPVNVVGTQS